LSDEEVECFFNHQGYKEKKMLKCIVLSKKRKTSVEDLVKKYKPSQTNDLDFDTRVSSIQIRKSSRLFASEQVDISSQKKSQNALTQKSTASVVVVDECSSSSSDCALVATRKEKRPLSIYSSEAVLNNSKKASQNSNQNIELEEYSLDEMNELASNNLFPKKSFMINDNIESYTPIFHFFDSLRVFNSITSNNILFVCKICGAELQASLRYSTNLNKHLNLFSHREKMKDWLDKYEIPA